MAAPAMSFRAAIATSPNTTPSAIWNTSFMTLPGPCHDDAAGPTITVTLAAKKGTSTSIHSRPLQHPLRPSPLASGNCSRARCTVIQTALFVSVGREGGP